MNDLLNKIVSHGDRGAIVPYSRIDDLKKEMKDLQKGDHHAWLDRMLERIDGIIPGGLGFTPRSLISIITPSPKVILQFQYRSIQVKCVLPPQYADEGSKDREVLQYINAYLSPLGYSAVIAINLPQKLLACHCGLSCYGRNNICYSEGYGSYLRILSYISDAPVSNNIWLPIRRMDSCENCYACVSSCPTKAIDSNRRLIHADKCLTSINEFDGKFPDWIDENAHHCIVGCMRCQDCCPNNAHNKNNTVEGIIFNEKETTVLLKNQNDEPYSDELTAKIAAAGISAWTHVLHRNLSVLLQNAF